jgi:hypothetical protein
MLVALVALAWATVFVPYMLSRAISRRWHSRSGVSPRTAAALSPARRLNAYLAICGQETAPLGRVRISRRAIEADRDRAVWATLPALFL